MRALADFVRLLLGAAAGCVSFAHAGTPGIDVPFEPSVALKAEAAQAGFAVGLYVTSPQTADRDLAALQADDSALDDALLALVAQSSKGQFHFARAGRGVTLAETSLSAHRAGKPVSYEDACKTWPTPGDRLTGRYDGAGWGTTVELEVVEHVPYVYAAGEPRAVRAGTQETCAKEEGGQTYYRGSVVLRRTAATTTRLGVVGYALQLR